MKKKPSLTLVALMSVLLMGCNPQNSSSVPSTLPSNTPASSASNKPSTPEDPEPSKPGVPSYESTYQKKDSYGNLLSKSGKYETDYGSIDQVYKAGQKLNKEIAEEGFVLLKNENDALPLSNREFKATAFGYKSVDLQTGGGGSGAGQTSYMQTYNMTIANLENSLENVGMKLNPVVSQYYKDENQKAGRNAGEIDPSLFSSDVTDSYKSYNDVALVVFARSGSEGSDLSSIPDENGKHSLSLSLTEEAIVRHAKQNFKKVVVLINAENPMEIASLQEKKTDDNLGVDAILQIGHVGVDGAWAIGEILTGEINPSGHTVDTWEKKFLEGPAIKNFATMAQNGIDPTTEQAYNNHYYIDGQDVSSQIARQDVEYRENVYMGYRYYETTAEDMNKKVAGSGETWYKDHVVYPFGYGLSYTNFEWTLDSSIDKEGLIDKANGTVTMKVNVRNTGKVAGKDVVQVYVNPPYHDGGIEKASANLMGFAKTRLLQPGESETVTVQFATQDFASYDWNDANENDFVGYELEAGDYTIYAGSDSHSPKVSFTRTIEEDIKCEMDLETGNKIDNVFGKEEGTRSFFNTTSTSLVDHLLTREGGLDGRTPEVATSLDRTITQAEVDSWSTFKDTPAYEDDVTDPWYVKQVPSSWTQETNRESGKGTAPIQLKDMIGVSYTEPTIDSEGNITEATDENTKKWETFLNQMTWEEMEAYSMSGGWGRRSIPALGVQEAADQDGPNQLGTQAGRLVGGVMGGAGGYVSRGGDLNNGNGLGCGTAFVSSVTLSSSWNTELARREGNLVGNFSLFLNIPGWYGPGMNIHRSPFGGRNFEYYSEDGILSGKFAAAVVGAATEKGVICYGKHLALNEQETNRSSVNTFVTEQAMREIYLKPYELAIKEGGITGFMNAMNYIGTWAAYSNGALQNDLLRKEWGFKGVCITDANGSGGQFKTIGIEFRNGTDINLARTTMNTTDTSETDGIVNQEPTVWDSSLRGGKGGIKVADTLEKREAANRKLISGWTEGINGSTEFRFYNWRDKSLVQNDLTLEAPTYYYVLRQAVRRSLYATMISNSVNNGMPSWNYHGDVVATYGITVDMSGDQAVFNKKVTDELVLGDNAFVTDCHIASGDSELPHLDNAIKTAIEEGKATMPDALVNDNESVKEWLNVYADGSLGIKEGAEVEAGEYDVVIHVTLNYWHHINVKVRLTVNK